MFILTLIRNHFYKGELKGMIKKAYSVQLTSYDILKTLAVLLMIVDHIGHYFFPDLLWIRVVGRLCVPMWFFLIGYANSRDLSRILWIGGAILVAGNVIVGMPIFALNILATIIVVRLVLDRVVEMFDRSDVWRYGTAVALVLLIIPTAAFVEYGASVLILAMYGYYLRHGRSKAFMNGFMIFTLLSFLISEHLFFGFSSAQFTVLGIGLFVVISALQFFKPCELPDLEKKLTPAGCFILRIGGRYSLEIYVVHLMLFKLIAVSMGYEDFGWFNLMIFPADMWG